MIYEYVCENCKTKETREVKLKDYAKPQVCTKCKKPLRKVYSSFGLKTNDGYKS